MIIVSNGYAQRGFGDLSAVPPIADSILLSKIPLEGLQVGDFIPDVSIKNIINYPGGTARFSDFKNQLAGETYGPGIGLYQSIKPNI